MSHSHSASTKPCMSKAVIPMAAFSIDGTAMPSRICFTVNPDSVLTPQTGHTWHVEMDHEMGNMQMHSLIPLKHNNQFVGHYNVETKRPRFIGPFAFTDAYMKTRRFVREFGDIKVESSENLYNPLKTSAKLFFEDRPHRRIEITAPRLLDDREILEVVAMVAPTGYQIENLLQRQS